MKIPSYKFLPLMYQLAARMGTKMMGGLGFHEVLNNVSKHENQTTIAFLLYYCILLFHSRKWLHKKVLSVIFIMLYKGKNILFRLLSYATCYSLSLCFSSYTSLTHTYHITTPAPHTQSTHCSI